MKIRLEVGKRYELNTGEVYTCTEMDGDDPLAIDSYGCGPFVIHGHLYHQDGRYGRGRNPKYDVKRCVDDTTKLWHYMTPEEKGELLLAYHEGKVIEWSYGLPFRAARNSGGGCHHPVWDDDCAYRIKPEPVRETVTLYVFSGGSSDKFRSIGTVDMVDGKPDCASVKMEGL